MYQCNFRFQCLTVSEQFKFVQLTLVIASGYKQYLSSVKIKKVKIKYITSFQLCQLVFDAMKAQTTICMLHEHFPMLKQDAVQSNCINVQGTTLMPG